MAAVMLAGMVPPLALALATVVRPRLFTVARARERQGRPGCWAPRSSPRAPSRSPRPTRCASSRRSWSAAPSPAALSMALDVTLRAPHGGIFVLFAVDDVARLPDRAGRRRRWSAAAAGDRRSRASASADSRRRHRLTAITVHHPPPRRIMPSKSVVVGSAVGLHARPAAIIAEEAAELGSEVTIDPGTAGRRQLLADDHDPGRRQRRHRRGGRRRPGRGRHDRRAGRAGPRRLSPLALTRRTGDGSARSR